MGIFSKATKTSSYDRFDDDDASREQPAPRDESAVDDTSSNVQTISPVALMMQEKLRNLDNLKTRVGGLNRTFEQMSALAAESGNSIQLLSEFVETSRAQIETEGRLKSDNARLTTDLLDRNHQVGALSTQLEEALAEVHSLRKRATETRTALENARNDIITIRDNNKKVNDEYRVQSAKLVEANAQVAELTGELKDLEAKFQSLEDHSESLKSELESVSHREKELQQNLSESAALLEQEIRKNNRATSELEAAKREIVDFRNENIDLKSRLDVESQELDYSKSRMEEEQRKHDNEVYALNAEIENLSSQRRIGAQSLQEMTRENTSLKERHRIVVKRMQEIEQLLEAAQNNHERDREELVTANTKLREVNLRYNSVLTDVNHARAETKRYAENLEQLVEENKKLQQYRIKYDTAKDQINQLKSVIANYQVALEEAGVPASRSGSLSAMTADTGAKDDEGGSDVIVNLRD
jgi:chromosome segregation ATPase